MALRDLVEFLSSEVTPRKREHTWYEKCSNPYHIGQSLLQIQLERIFLQSTT
jgi:hypothetical protein